MAEDNKASNVLLRYTIDRQALTTTVQGTNGLERNVDKINSSLQKLEPAASQGFGSLRQRIEQSQGRVREMTGDVENLRQELLALDRVRVEPEIVVKQTGERRNEEARQGIGDLSTTLGSGAAIFGGSSELGGALAGAGDVLGLIEYIPQANKALASLTPQMIGLTGATTVLTVAIAAQAEQQRRVEELIRARLDAEAEAIRFLATATREQTEAKIADLQRELAIEEQIARERGIVAGEFLAQMNAGQAALSLVGLAGAEYRGALAKLEESTTEVVSIREEIAELEHRLELGATAANDTKAAVEGTTNALNRFVGVVVDSAQALAEEEARLRAQQNLEGAEAARQRYLIEQQLLSGTAEQAEAYYRQLEQTNNGLIIAKTALEHSGDTSEEVAAQINEYNQQIEANADLMLTIAAEIAPALRQAEEDAKAAKGAVDLLTGGFRSFMDEAEAVIELGQRFGAEYDKLATGLADNLQKLSANRDSRLLELADDLQRDLAELGQAYIEQQEKQQEEGQEQLVKFHKAEEQRAKEHHQRLLQISRDGSYAIEDAAADRNIRAALEAERSLKDRLSDEQSAFDLQSEQRKDELDELKDNLSDQERERLRDYQKRYNDLIEQNRREVAAVHSKYQQEVNLQYQAYNQQLSALRTQLAGEIGLKTEGYNAMLQSAGSFANGLVSIGQNLINSLTGMGSGSTGGDGRNIIVPDTVILSGGSGGGGASHVAQVPTFARGGQALGLASVNDDPRRRLESGLTSSGKLVFFTEPTTVLDGSRTRRLLEGDTTALPGGMAPRGGGATIIQYAFGDINVSVSGTNANPKQIAREVAIEFKKELQRRRA